MTTDASKIIEDDYNMIISMEEEQKTLIYQETMKLDVENIFKKKHMETNI